MMYKHSLCLTDPLHSHLTFPPAKLWQQLPQPSRVFPLFLDFGHSLTYRGSSESTEKTVHRFQKLSHQNKLISSFHFSQTFEDPSYIMMGLSCLKLSSILLSICTVSVAHLKDQNPEIWHLTLWGFICCSSSGCSHSRHLTLRRAVNSAQPPCRPSRCSPGPPCCGEHSFCFRVYMFVCMYLSWRKPEGPEHILLLKNDERIKILTQIPLPPFMSALLINFWTLLESIPFIMASIQPRQDGARGCNWRIICS